MNDKLKPIYSFDLDPSEWTFMKNNDFSVSLDSNGKNFLIDVNKQDENASHTFLFYKEISPLNSNSGMTTAVVSKNNYKAAMYGEIQGGLEIQLIVLGFNKGNRVFTEYVGMDIEKNLNLPDNVTDIKLVLRVSGVGRAEIKIITIKAFEYSVEEIDREAYLGNEEAEYLVLTNVYPEKNNLYRNMFVHRRAELYETSGIKVDVFRFNSNQQSLGNYYFEDIHVMSGGKQHLSSLLKTRNYKKILIHFVNKDMIEAIEESKIKIPIVVWIHGVETEKWYRRWFNFSSNSKDLERAINNIKNNKITVDFMKSIYESETLDIKFVFVSKWFKEAVAENDTNAVVNNYEIIHNVVDEQLFNYQEKDRELRKKILSIRPYASRKYANDLTVKAILELSKKPFFNELEFNLYGQGPLFHEILEPIKHFSNVNIYNYFLSQDEIAQKHKENGVFICPTRLDSQGVSMCEAMSSGLVPITSGVTAIPEFVDEESGYLGRKENYMDLALAIEELYYNPEIFQKKSYNAARRMKNQCGKQKVIEEELEVITS
ncbi:glycosyltransferase family 4 protein [Ornithinibacillus sp. 179-J 7C1 HS]|uniref:glycosyltransferase family 4 protein n=1 Tax=Ornithinibacillus sp. 179-J 7C1 HS TaxID=3142384 RepID=UPI0039A0E083